MLIVLSVLMPALSFATDNMGVNGFYISRDMTTYTSTNILALLNQMKLDSPNKNILFYVHGRSQTLEKEWSNINTMERMYNVRVLMLHWESWNYMMGRPVANAKEASKQLSLGLEQVSIFKKTESEFFQDHKIFIMFHSMGNIVLKNYIEKYNNIQDTSLFDTAILTGADAPFTGHKNWLSQVKLSPDLYVVMNQKDSVLLASMAHDYIDLSLFSKNDDRLGLGKGLDNMLFLNTKTAANARYFDITKLSGGDHRHYLSSNREVEDLFHFMFKESFVEIPLDYKVKKNYYKF
jgi:hypothetical protein